MKILQLIQKNQLRGAEVFASQLSNLLETLSNSIILVSLFTGNSSLPFNGKKIELNLKPRFRWLDYKGFKRVARLIEEEAPDIVQANAGDTLKYAVLSKILFGWKQPIVFRNASMVSLYIKNPVIKLLNRFLYQHTTAIASVSLQSKRDLNNLFPITTGRSEVIPIGIEIGKIKPIEKVYNPQIVHVGGFSFEKNHEGLLRIFKYLLGKYPEAHLSLIGDGPLLKRIENKLKIMRLDQTVTFHGYVPNPMDYITSADVLVLPSIIEGLPGVILESFYCKTPIVAYCVGGISEVVEHNVTGKLIRKGDEQAFANAIIQLLEEKEKTKFIIENAYQVVQQHYTIEVIADKFLSLYKRIL